MAMITDRSHSSLAPDAIERLRARLKGRLILPEDEEFDARRRVWNGMIDRRPALIAECACAEDVQAAVGFARSEALALAVRGGGHSAAGLGTCDGGIVIDLAGMRAVAVDPVARTARAEGGATWGDFDAATQAHGLAVTGGAVSTTGIGGLTLGGGIGWLTRRFGLASDNVIAFDVVTADGELVTASADSHPDLYWALRGGGGNFGVVTAFTYRLHPVGEVTGGIMVHPLDRAGEMLRFYRDATQRASDDLALFAGLMSSPDGDPIGALATCHSGEADVADAELAPVRSFGPPVADDVVRRPYTAQQTMIDPAFPAGLQVYWKAHFLAQLSDEVIDLLVAQFGRVTSPLSVILIEHLGGEVARIDADATAFDHRDAAYNLAIIARWADPADADRHIAWARETFEAVRPFASGVYVNYLGVGDGAERVRDAYGEAKYARLAQVKARYDPDNLFSGNQNIAPAG
jgi:FAD/FMN-containing dehydrogenase